MKIQELIKLAKENHLCNLPDEDLKLYLKYMPRIQKIEQQHNFANRDDEDYYFERCVNYDLYKAYYCLIENQHFSHPSVTVDLIWLPIKLNAQEDLVISNT